MSRPPSDGADAHDAHASGSDSENDDDGLGGKSLYEILNVPNTATPSEIKKAYHKAALQVHPDKNKSPDAAEKFQTLQKVYGILSDENKRAIYDETGDIDDGTLSGDQFKNLYEYYRNVYKKVTEEDVDVFFDSYRGSDEEKNDVISAYAKFNGDMTAVFAWVMCSEEKVDAHRFADMIDDALAKNKISSFQIYETWATATRKKPAPKNPLKPQKKQVKGTKKDDTSDLAALILAKREHRAGDLFASLEAKYGQKEKKKNAKDVKVKGGVAKGKKK